MKSSLMILLIGGMMSTHQLISVELSPAASSIQICEASIAIGSNNPVKINAVKNALDGENVRVVPCAALSNVRSQPLSDEETLQGAINRAKNCLEKTPCSLAVGLEAGIVFFHEQPYLCHWGAIVDRNHNTYVTNGPLILLPKAYQQKLLQGKNLEDIMHDTTGIENLGVKEGAIGVFTQNRLNREQVLTQMVKALIGQYRFYQPQNECKTP